MNIMFFNILGAGSGRKERVYGLLVKAGNRGESINDYHYRMERSGGFSRRYFTHRYLRVGQRLRRIRLRSARMEGDQ